jgi:cytochrome c7-like protein/class III cytochrome C family protein
MRHSGALDLVSGVRNVAVALIAAVMGMCFLFAATLAAQQAPPAAAGKQEVPNNPSEHAPPVQPIPYSHKTHLALGLTCQTCHTNPDPGRLMTFPATSRCMQCHVAVAKDKPSIQKLAEYSRSATPIPWVRVYALLPGIQWSHRRHLQAGLECGMCHGQVSQIERMSEVTSVTTMYSCYHCHQIHNAPTVCETCHAWPENPVQSSNR